MLYKKSLIILAFISISCTSTIKIGSNIASIGYDVLALISADADKAVAAQIMSKADRQLLARNYMIPAITANEELVNILKSYKPGDPIPVQIFTLSGLILRAGHNIVDSLPASSIKNQLQDSINKALAKYNEILKGLK